MLLSLPFYYFLRRTFPYAGSSYSDSTLSKNNIILFTLPINQVSFITYSTPAVYPHLVQKYDLAEVPVEFQNYHF